MATALPTNPDLECFLCCERFVLPNILSCGHSFCCECLMSNINDRKGKFPCPVCQQDVVIPEGGVDMFTTNLSLQNLENSVRTVDIATIQPSTGLNPIHDCPNHSKKEADMYCQTCRLDLCSECIEAQDHTGHKMLDLKLDSTKAMVCGEIFKSEQIVKHKIEEMETTKTTLIETSEKLKSFKINACTEISEKTEKIIGELKENCGKRQQEIGDHFDINELKLTETQNKVMTQITNIRTGLDAFRPTTTEEPSLTLIYSLNKLQDVQKLCENMKTDIPTVTYVEWRERKSVKVCDILGSTETKLLCHSSEGNVFRFNCTYKNTYQSKDEFNDSIGMVWSCKIWLNFSDAWLGFTFLSKAKPRVKSCKINYTTTILNKDENKNVSETSTRSFKPGHGVGLNTKLKWNKLTDPSLGFIDNKGQFLVKFDILQVIDIQYKYKRYDV